MPRVGWDESFSVNHQEIDEQHKRWLHILNTLHEALLDGDPDILDTITVDALTSMQEYAAHHFEFEEKYMEEVGYPNLVAHRRLHKDFNDRIYLYEADIREGRTVLNTEIITVLKNWLVDHILGADMQYSRFVADGKGG